MCAMALDVRPPGRGPVGPVERPRRSNKPQTDRPVVRAISAGPPPGYRRLKGPLDGYTQRRQKTLPGEAMSSEPDQNTTPKHPGSRDATPQPCKGDGEIGIVSVNVAEHGGSGEQGGGGAGGGRMPSGPGRTECPQRRPVRLRPATLIPNRDGLMPLISCHSKRTISRASRRSRPASSIDDRCHGHKGDADSDSDDHGVAHRASSSIDFFSADIGADTGWDTDLEQDDVKESYDATGRAIYLESCRKTGVIPASYFLRHMQDSRLEMKHHGLGPAGVKPLAVALVSNTSVVNLNLQDNWLGTDGGSHICEMLKENCYITHLDLSDNKLGAGFSLKFMHVLNSNNTLTHITLSGNLLDDGAARYLSEAIMNTTKLEYVDLSHNQFGESAGEWLGMAISENSSVKQLDLSWNCMRRKGAVAIANGIKTNVLMQKVNLSWNGFGNEGAGALGDALKANSSLEELDVSNNRINTEGSVLLGKGLAVNETMKVLKMGQNPMQSSGCYAICAALLTNPNSIMEILDFTDILINNDFLDVFKNLKEQLPGLKLRHGGDGMAKKPKVRVHPMVKLKNYIEKHNLRLVDFFNKFDQDNSMSVTRQEFTQGIQESGLILAEDEVAELLDELDKDGDGEINYSELVIGHQDFRDLEDNMSTSHMSGGESLVWKT